MKNTIVLFIGFLIVGIISLSSSMVYAADVSVRLDEPNSPTNVRDFKLGFVVSDILGRTVEITCYEKGPSDGGFSIFDTTKNYTGSGSGECSVASSITSEDGTYQFYVTATAGGNTVSSQVVAVDVNTTGPGTPISYAKEKTSCEYKIKFTTANDGGKTDYVEIYRSETTTIGLDAGSRVGTVSTGSNEEKSFSNTTPDCGKEYYFAIRAFDSSGNGSGAIGDTVVKTVTSSTITVSNTGNVGSQSSSSSSTGAVGDQGVSGVGAIAVDPEDSFVQEETTDTTEDNQEVSEEGTEEQGDESMQEVEETTGDGVLGAQDENKPFFLIAWILAVVEWFKSLFQ